MKDLPWKAHSTLCLSLIICFAFPAEGAQGKGDPKKVAFTSRDVCSKTGVAVRFEVKVKEDRAFVVMTCESGAAMGKAIHIIIDAKSGTIRYLDPVRKVYTTAEQCGLGQLPLFGIAALALQGGDPSAWKDRLALHGTFFVGESLSTQVDKVEQPASFKEVVFAVPEGYRRLRETAPDTSRFLGGSPFGVYTGTVGEGPPISGHGVSLPLQR